MWVICAHGVAYLISASLSEEGTLYTVKNGAFQPDFGCSTNKANSSIASLTEIVYRKMC